MGGLATANRPPRTSTSRARPARRRKPSAPRAPRCAPSGSVQRLRELELDRPRAGIVALFELDRRGFGGAVGATAHIADANTVRRWSWDRCRAKTGFAPSSPPVRRSRLRYGELKTTSAVSSGGGGAALLFDGGRLGRRRRRDRQCRQSSPARGPATPCRSPAASGRYRPGHRPTDRSRCRAAEGRSPRRRRPPTAGRSRTGSSPARSADRQTGCARGIDRRP